MGGGDHAEIITLPGEADPAGGRPVPFVVRDGESSVRADTHAIRITHARGEDFEFRAISRDLEQRTLVVGLDVRRPGRTLSVVEVPLRVGLEIHRELVKVRRDHAAVVEVFVIVRLVVAVQVVQSGDLIAAQHVHGTPDDAQSERLEEPRRVALPGDLRERAADSGDDPHVAVERRHRGTAGVGEEIERAQTHVRLPGVLVGHGDRVDDVGPGPPTHGGLRF